MITPRPYQHEALDALHNHICEKDTNPCIVIPTGGGKSALIAWIIKKWKTEYQHVRINVLAHRKELIEQNYEELLSMRPDFDVGIFSAGLHRKDYDADVLFASIDSIYKRSGEFQPWDVLMVDEAHRIPPKGEGKYRTFLQGCRRWNPGLRLIGWTATPFRMGCGSICHRDHLLNEICYEAKVTDLIHDGFLSHLRSKVGVTQPDLNGVRRNSGGDYITSSLSRVTNRDDVVRRAVEEAVRLMDIEDRKHAVFFCVDIEHCDKVNAELQRLGVNSRSVNSKTRPEIRERIANDFKSGNLSAVCNVNVYTEGFNATCTDCIVLLRPTLSEGLFSQMVGRGLRLHVGKSYCLVLDFANCIDEHGPIDLLGGQRVPMAICEICRESFSRALGECPHCGWRIPKKILEKLEKSDNEKRLHGVNAANKSILSGVPETVPVHAVFTSRHRKPGSPDMVRVQYRSGSAMYSEYICLDHEGYAGVKAKRWWGDRFGLAKTASGIRAATVNEALSFMFLTQTIADYTKTITVKRHSKRKIEIIGYNNPISDKVVQC